MQKFNEDTKVNIYSSKGMNQDGNTYLDNTLDIRDITIQVIITPDSQAELIGYRKQMQEVLNPKLGEGYLIYQDDLKEHRIKCISNKIPTLGETVGITQTFLISLTANNPLWEDTLESRKDIALWVADFSFDLEITDAGFEFEHRSPSLIVNANNTGDIACGMKIEFRALGTVVNPSLFNINTREYIKINKTLKGGETVTVTTHFGNKRVESNLNGIVSNAFNYIDLDTTFIQLETGDNYFRYDADSNMENLEVSIYFTTQYLGV